MVHPDRIVLQPIFVSFTHKKSVQLNKIIASFTDTQLTLTVPGMVIQKG